MKRATGLAAGFLTIATAAAAQQAADPVRIGDVAVSVSFRTRLEAWNWFDGDANDDYVFSSSLARVSFRRAQQRYTWQIELGAPVLVGLPADAIANGAQGQLGLGASYFAANQAGGSTASILRRLHDQSARDGKRIPRRRDRRRRRQIDLPERRQCAIRLRRADATVLNTPLTPGDRRRGVREEHQQADSVQHTAPDPPPREVLYEIARDADRERRVE